ncbi:helix-turn-helix domain-containing protein [Aureimonas altamirensis]|uniref:helix-turn-helix domain-containing protein n=1 Tax=Aureimonas altamirensis TaxID=370622 RepID=UPI002036D1BA|nr:helix-turn-helix domain-containing protein [Aureimonas altamirensis]MCM2506079.1 helix-turn-helix domain-containing protein [Aureimonas altamirensis]
MTAELTRAPMSARATALILPQGGAAVADLFAHIPLPDGPSHPDHLARLAIWRDQKAGLISVAEAQRRSANVGREETAKADRQNAPARPRHTRPSPNDSRQYAGDMATTAARDDRLTPNAKAFLQVIRARCGKGSETEITKGTAGNIMSRSTRTIRRYLVDLVRFGYVQLTIKRNHRGMHLGLVVTITEKVRPFYEQAKGLAAWLAEEPKVAFQPFSGVLSPRNKGVTHLSPKNQTKQFYSSTSFGRTDTGRETARGTLSRRIGASFVPPS